MDWLINFLVHISIWGVAKILVLIALLIYLVFAIVVVRQVYLMTKVVSGGIDLAVKLLAWIHLLFVIFVIFLAIIVL